MSPSTALLDPGRQLLGCVMWLPVQAARRLLADMSPDDMADPFTGWVLELAQSVVAANHPPEPVALFEQACETTPLGPRTGGGQRLSRLGVWLADTYGATSSPSEAHAAWLKAIVLRHAWRRAVRAYATRVLQAAEQCPTDELRRISTDTTELERLWRRYQAATDPHQPHITDTTVRPGRREDHAA